MWRGIVGRLLVVCAAAALASCTARSAQTGGCVPGSTEACACVDGRAGVRFCQNDQTVTACVCSGDGAAANDVALNDVALNDVALNDVALNDGALNDGALNDGALNDGALNDGALSDGALSDGGPVVDAAPSLDVPVDVAPIVDAVTDSGARDAGPTYPPGPYGSRTCSRFAPFRLSTCDGDLWDFAGPDFFTSTLTVVLIDAMWSVPSQSLANRIESTLGPYRSRGVRVVEALVEAADRTPIAASGCRTWRSRYMLTVPVLMDPSATLSVYLPSLAFPAAVLVDGHGQLRARLYGADADLTTLRAAIDDVLANPDTCSP